MPERKQPEREPEADETPETTAQSPASAPDDLDARIESALGKLAASGRLIGGEEAESGDSRAGRGGAESSSPSFDLDDAIERAFKRREDASSAQAEGKRTQDRLHALENPPKKSRWWDPWRP